MKECVQVEEITLSTSKKLNNYTKEEAAAINKERRERKAAKENAQIKAYLERVPKPQFRTDVNKSGIDKIFH